MHIGIMQKRYQDPFEVSMDIPEYLRSLEVPKLFLQPFVENAIVHGFKNYQDSGKIWISAEEEENDILFYVEDNGCGICEEDLKEVLNKERKSIGVRNTNKRIREQRLRLILYIRKIISSPILTISRKRRPEKQNS